MGKLLASLLLALTPALSGAHELVSALGSDTVAVSSQGGATTVEYCPDNTCEVFVLSGASAPLPAQDFAFAYLLGVSGYIYLEPLQSGAAPPPVQAFLGRYRPHCPQPSTRQAARCIVGVLAKKHPVRASFVRYDEGERNVVPISLKAFRDGT
jgi:hypothetical protein